LSARAGKSVRLLFDAVSASLTLLLLLEQPLAIAHENGMDTIVGEHAGHAVDPHAHHHPEADSGYRRSLATYQIPAVTMRDQNSRQVALAEFLATDKPVMLNFIFTTCTAICPVMSAIFATVQTELGNDSRRLRMVSISIDPEHDTPEVLSNYARRFGAGPQWEFLTGSLDESIAVQQAFDADRGDKMNHAPLTLFHPAPDAQWVRYEGFATARQLVEEYRNAVPDGAPE
jgi:protein SCO1